ncbi:MAG: hypothetical protein AD742_07290 [Methylibium sp. NZG]|nr:MAG: hypothetical protein AD742_07290 [Methylibium sp. NZG]
MLIIAVVVGAILGAAWGDAFGTVAGALLGWLLVRSHQQERQLAALREALKQLQIPTWRSSAQAPASSAEGGAAAGAAVASAAALPATGAGAGAGAGASPRARTSSPAGAALSAPDGADVSIARQSLQPSAASLDSPAQAAADTLWDSQPPSAWQDTRQESPPNAAPPAPPAPAAGWLRGWLLGGNTIVKAGVAILFLGLAFLAKYASEQVQVPVEVRLAGIAAVAVVLLGLGWRLRHSRPGYAQVLQGGAVAVLYLTLFVAFRFYGVLAVGPVFALMVLVAALAAALAVLQNAKALAVIGALGGFATPLLVSSGDGNHVALFGYYLVLNLGIAAVAWHKTWRALNLVGFAFTFVVGAVWGVLSYREAHYLSAQAFLIANFLLFNAILLMPARRLAQADSEQPSTGPHRTDAWVNGSLLFGLPTITFALQHGLVQHTPYGTAISALVMAALYVLMAGAMRSRPNLAVTFDASLAIAIVFLSLVIPFALDARSTAGAWALEGAGLVWLGFRQSRGLPRVFGYTLLLLAGVAMVWAMDRHGVPTTLFNAWFFSALMAAVGSFAAAYFVQRAVLSLQGEPTGRERAEALAEPLLIGWGTLWAVVAVGVQIDTFVRDPFTLAAWLVGVSAIALVCTVLSVRLDWPKVAFPALAHAPLLVLGVLASALDLARPTDGGGWWAWPLALATHLAVLRWAAPRWPAVAQRAVHALGVLVLAALGALQGRAVTNTWGDTSSAWPWLGWLAVPALLLMLLPRPATARRWPVSAAPSAYQGAASAALAAGLLLWALLANLISNGSAQPLPYLPLLNPLDLGVGVALLAVALWLRSDAARSALGERPQLTSAVLGVAGFVWLNAMLIRAFHHFGGVPFEVNAWVNSLAVQTGITLLWAATALVLMWLAARRAMRLPWMVGAALLAAVVLKLLLVDLSGTGTVMRIVSFIGVGVLMLVIGYVAPLPASGSSKEQGHAAG